MKKNLSLLYLNCSSQSYVTIELCLIKRAKKVRSVFFYYYRFNWQRVKSEGK